MAKRALYQATERTIGAATDILHIGNSNKDYKITFANLCQYILAYLTGTYFITQAVKNISAGNQVTNLSVYEAGGASEKPNGFRIKVSWTGGNKTYSHAWTGTTYNFLLPDGSVVAPSVMVGYGAGSLALELNKTNSVWIVCNDNGSEWDRWDDTTNDDAKIIKYTNDKMEMFGVEKTGTALAVANNDISTYGWSCYMRSETITFPLSFAVLNHCSAFVTSDNIRAISVNKGTVSVMKFDIIGISNVTPTYKWYAEGTWR